MITLSVRRPTSNVDFQRVADSFLASNGLAFGSVMPAVEIQRIFQKHDSMFGNTYNGIYTTAIVLWAYLSQVLADGKMRSCTAAVARIVAFRIGNNQAPPSKDTGDYCKARQKLADDALYELMFETARKIEFIAPEPWLWNGRHVKLVDGFTATMPDTPDNQAEFPQPKSQKPGIGFPILWPVPQICLLRRCRTPVFHGMDYEVRDKRCDSASFFYPCRSVLSVVHDISVVNLSRQRL